MCSAESHSSYPVASQDTPSEAILETSFQLSKRGLLLLEHSSTRTKEEAQKAGDHARLVSK